MARGRSLWSSDPIELQHEFRAVSLALAACEKSVQIVYERNLRPKEAQYEPWMARVTGQLLAAYAALEHEVQLRPAMFSAHHNQTAITAAVVWQFDAIYVGISSAGLESLGFGQPVGTA